MIKIIAKYDECIEEETTGMLFNAVYEYIWDAKERKWEQHLFAEFLGITLLLGTSLVTPDSKKFMRDTILLADETKVIRDNEVRVCKIDRSEMLSKLFDEVTKKIEKEG